MKIAQYNDMMSYLTRPGFKDGDTVVPPPKPLTESQVKNKLDLYIKGFIGGFDKMEMIDLMNEISKKADESGVMSQEDVFNFVQERKDFYQKFLEENKGEGVELPRQDFAAGDLVTTPELKEILKKQGLVLKDSTFSQKIQNLGVKQEKAAGKFTTYVEPSKEEIKEIIELNKQKRAKGPSPEQAKGFEDRKKKVAKLIRDKKGNITQKAILDQFEGGMKPSKATIKQVAEELGFKLPSGREKGNVDIENVNARTKKLIQDINILKNDKKLNDIILKPDFDIAEDILKLQKRATEILPKTGVDPVRRVAQLLIAYQGDDPDLARYVGQVSDDLKMAADDISPGLRTGKFGGLIGTMTRLAAEKRAAIDIGKNPGFFASQRKRLGELIQNITGKKGMASIDEVKAISGNRAKSPIYNIFVQGIKQDINEDKLNQIDRLTANAEINLQNAKTEKEKIKIKDEYNARVQEFVDNANKDLKPGQLPIRAFKLSLDKPSNTIKNKKAYKKNKSYFDDVYNKHGYSFEVPEDILTSEQAKTYLNTDEGKARVKNQVKLGSGRLLAVATLGGLGIQAAESLFKPSEASAADTEIQTEKEMDEGVPTEGAAASAVLFGKYAPQILKGLKKVGKGAITLGGAPTTSALLSGSNILDVNIGDEDKPLITLQEDPNIRTAGADLLLPELLKRTGIKNVLLNPFGKAARAFTPVGIATILGGQAYEFYKQRKELERLKEEDPEAYEKFISSRVDKPMSAEEISEIEDFGREGAMYGGRMGYADGPDDPGKRKFMKIMMGGLASLPVLSRFFKVGEMVAPVAEKAVDVASGAPPYFFNLVDRIRALGTKYAGPKERSEFYRYKDYEMDIDLDTGAIDIKKTKEAMIPGGDEAGVAEEVIMTYKPGMADETTKGKKVVDEYDEYTARPDIDGKMKDVEDGVPDEVIEEGSIGKEELEQEIIDQLARDKKNR